MSDEKKCPDCGTDLVDSVCPQCKKPAKNETGTPTKNQAVPNTGSGWGAPINRKPSTGTPSGGFCNG